MTAVNVLPAVAAVRDLDALKVVSDAQRHRLLTALIAEPLTARELSDRLGIARTRIYYHIELLERHGFVRAVRERLVSGIAERTYRATARRFQVDRDLLSAHASHAEVVQAQTAILDAVAADARASEGPDEAVLIARSFVRLGAERAGALRAALEHVLRSYGDVPDADGEVFELAVAMFVAPPAAG